MGREERALSSQLVNMWRFEIIGTVATKVAIALVIGEDDQHAWWTLLGIDGGRCFAVHC
jgi:hypothetical protein